jgi:hypothetical protein
MKTILTSELLPDSKLHRLCRGRIQSTLYIIILLFTLPALISAQQPAWRLASPTDGSYIFDIDVYHNDLDSLFAMSDDSLMLSTDMGENWIKIAPFPQLEKLSNVSGLTLKIDPFNSNHLYVSHLFLPIDGNVILKSTNSGMNWKLLFWGRCEPYPGCDSPIIEIDPVDLNSIYASLNTNLIIRSTDRGENWDTIPEPYTFGLSSIAISPSNNRVIYLGFGSTLEIYKSVDQGETWQLLPFPLSNQTSSPVYLAVHPDNSDILYAAVFSFGYFQGGVYKSTDGGFTWDEKNNGLTNEDYDINTINIYRKNPEEIYIGTGGNINLFRSTNGGENWLRFDNGLPNTGHVTSIVIDTLNDRIYLGRTKGIYIYDVPTAIKDETIIYSDRFLLNQNYPNPFNSITKIRYYVAKNDLVILKVYDVLGREVAVLVDEEKKPGTYEIEFNANNLSSGIYFYQISSGNFPQTRSMILLK